MKLRIKALLAAAVMAAGCIFCTGCNPMILAMIGSAVVVPTSMGVVTDSRITSADQTAAQIRNNTTSYLTKLNSKSITMTNNYDFTLVIEIDESGRWALYGGSYGDWLDSTNHWGTDSSYDTNKEIFYTAYMKDMLADLTNAYAEVHFSNGKCIGAAVIPGQSSRGNVTMPSLSDFKGTTTSAFSEKSGQSGDTIVGTAPKLDVGGYYYY